MHTWKKSVVFKSVTNIKEISRQLIEIEFVNDGSWYQRYRKRAYIPIWVQLKKE